MGATFPRLSAALGAAVVAGAALATWWLCRPRGLVLASSVVMADVSTGELFEFPVGGGASISVPARNPGTGARSLLPVNEDGGRWYLGPRERGALGSLGVPLAAVMDAATGELRAVGRPRRIR